MQDFFFLISKSTKRKQLEFLVIELIYIIYSSHNFLLKFCFCSKKSKREYCYAFIITRLRVKSRIEENWVCSLYILDANKEILNMGNWTM